jgi:hypothetical protein
MSALGPVAPPLGSCLARFFPEARHSRGLTSPIKSRRHCRRLVFFRSSANSLGILGRIRLLGWRPRAFSPAPPATTPKLSLNCEAPIVIHLANPSPTVILQIRRLAAITDPAVA